MNEKAVLNRVIKGLDVPEHIVKEAERLSKTFIENLNKALKKNKNQAIIFIGGSFAKGTWVKKEIYDIDLLVRFKIDKDNLSDILEKAVKSACSTMHLSYERVHGSRDYFRVAASSKIILEVIPVLLIAKPSKAKNVTDLSYFHVSYMKKHARGLENQVRLAKAFCQAQGVYGAEGYIRGFSGYALECLIIYYRSFIKMLNALNKTDKPIVLDYARHYRNKNALVYMNQSKLASPIILIDPTFKERNALAALSNATFDKFKIAARSFLKSPSEKFFEKSILSVENFKKTAKLKRGEFVNLVLETDKQAGDIAGTKLYKFYNFLKQKLEKDFIIIESYFKYDEKSNANCYMILRSRIKRLVIGPPLKMKEHAMAFRKKHAKTFEKKGRLYSYIYPENSAKKAILEIKNNHKQLAEMNVTRIGAT